MSFPPPLSSRSLYARSHESGRPQSYSDQRDARASHFLRLRDAAPISCQTRKSSHYSGQSILGKLSNEKIAGHFGYAR